jgi:hypothetical protein
MDQNLFKQLERIENKLDLILKSFSTTETKKPEDSQDQFYFPWYNDFKPATPSDVLK